MPKYCNCTVDTVGLPTYFPLSFNFCSNCGKPLQEEELSLEAMSEKLKNVDSFRIARPVRTRAFTGFRRFNRSKFHILEVYNGEPLCGTIPKKGWVGTPIPVKDMLNRVCKTCKTVFDRRFVK